MLSLWRGTLYNTLDRNLALLHESLLMQGYGIYWTLGCLFKEIHLSVLFKCVNTLQKVTNPICIRMQLSCICNLHLNINDYSLINAIVFFFFISSFRIYFFILFSQVDLKKKRYFLLGHISRFANNVKRYLIGVHNQTIYEYKTRIIKTNMNP